MRKEGEEIMELKHDPVPGYRTIFYIVLTIASLYLAVILVRTV
ncbi:MAG: hypothetical protein Q8N12_07290 [Thermodesulfovibrionales bacterium]|nr:hypothetical protein [Thermodesulfovibrionales bacterium]